MNNQGRDTFIFYRSFQEAIDELNKTNQLAIYRAIAEYSFNQQEPKLNNITKIVWKLIKPQLDANWKRYTNGRKGGAPTGNRNNQKSTESQPKVNQKSTESQPKVNQKLTKSQPNKNNNKNVNNNKNNNVNIDIEEKVSIDNFSPPTLLDLEQYITNQRLSVAAAPFFDYYTSNGWMMGKNPMVDWRAALRIWSRKSESEQPQQQIPASDDL